MQAKHLFGLNMTTTKAGLTGISGGATTHSTGSAAISYCIDGKAYSKSQISGGTTPTVDGQHGGPISLVEHQGTVVVWCLNAGGDVVVLRGTVEALDDEGDFIVPPQFPGVPSHLTPFAYTLHRADDDLSGTWTFGSDNWNVSGMTHTVVDVMVLPDRPQLP